MEKNTGPKTDVNTLEKLTLTSHATVLRRKIMT